MMHTSEAACCDQLAFILSASVLDVVASSCTVGGGGAPSVCDAVIDDIRGCCTLQIRGGRDPNNVTPGQKNGQLSYRYFLCCSARRCQQSRRHKHNDLLPQPHGFKMMPRSKQGLVYSEK